MCVRFHRNFQDQVLNLCIQWKIYLQIYKTNENIKYYNISPIFFGNLRKILEGNLILTVTKLFDRAYEKNKKNEIFSFNLGFLYLIEQLKIENFNPNNCRQIETRVNSFKEDYRSSIFAYRNKLIGHSDFPTVRKRDYEEIIKNIFTSTNLEKTIDWIVDITNDFVPILLEKSFTPDNPDNFYAHAPCKLDFKAINVDADKMVYHLNNVTIVSHSNKP